ncbi:MAG: Stk1 family PASTA domain-containing Ser/Thr kinase [Coprococcus phoceensis]
MIKEGVLIGDRYEIMGRIGTGGMADVYKGRDHKLNRYVALKVLKREFREDELFVKKFQSEAQAAAGLMHPNIVNVYDVGEDRGLYFMVMELVEGITLKEYIQKKVRLTPKEVISITLQVCAGIEAAHNNGIIHRDIKPQNIMISKEGKVKVTDFGIAKATTSNTISTNAMGSVHYTSPEQARGGFSDIRSDIYSLGITMFEMITGELPFDGETTVSIAIKHLQEDIAAPSELVPDIPYSLERIILKCTQKSSDRRYQNMGELISDLKRSLVDPEGDFVTIAPFANIADTVAITPDELERIQKEAAYDDEYDGYNDEDYDDNDEYDEYDEEDDEYDEYDDEDYEKGKRGSKKKDSEVNPKMAKLMKILTAVVAAIIVFILVFTVGKATGLLKFNSKNVETTDNKKVETPNFEGKTLEEAKALAKKKGLTLEVVKEATSTKYEKGIVSKQMTGKGTSVKKGTKIQVWVSTGLEGEEITIPDVSGMSEEEAKETLIAKGFKKANISVEQKQSDSVDTGLVISTTPEADAKAAEDTKITIYVSTGAGKVTVPNLVGKSQEEAESALSEAGLNGSASEEYSDTEAGKVISQEIDSGEKVDKGTTVSYVVSKGKKPEEKVTMPPVVGVYQSRAESLLRAAGLSVGKVTSEYSDTDAEGVVISASFNEGDKLNPGTVVNLVVSKGAKPSDPETPTTPDQGNGNSSTQ